MTAKEIARLIQNKFFEEKQANYPWYVIGNNVLNNGEQHFVLFCENKNCYCKATVNNKDQLIYFKFFC